MSLETGILLANLGGPDSLDAVRPFLYNLFSDPDIIRLPLPWLFQKPLAWTISTSRYREVQHNYAAMGGRSPILPQTEIQADALRRRLQSEGVDLPVEIAMRYWHPFTDEAVGRLREQGVKHVIVVPLYPQFSFTTTGSSVNALRHELRRQGLRWELEVLPPYYQHPDYLAALAETIQDGLNAGNWSCPPERVNVIFSAHSLPRRHVIRTGDPYPEQIRATADAVMKRAFPNNPWEICYQSKVGNLVWLGPDTEGMLHYLAATDEDNVLMVPISFVSEHLETLYEIDQLYLPLAEELGLKHVSRVRALVDNPRYIECLAQGVLQLLREKYPSLRPATSVA